jgi:type IV pilus assembly protein PilX
MQQSVTNRVHASERGAVLVISLLMLLVMTVLGLTAMQMTRMEERMAGNSRDVNVAFQGAEAGLRDAEERLRAMVARPSTCVAAPCVVFREETLPVDLRDQPLSWWMANATEFGTSGTQEVTDVVRDPLVVIEDLGFVRDSLAIGHEPPQGRNFYRITANSAGATPQTEAVLESTYTRPF